MLNRTPWSPKPEAKKRPVWKLSKQKHLELIKLLAPYMRKAEPTPFAEEAERRLGCGPTCV